MEQINEENSERGMSMKCSTKQQSKRMDELAIQNINS
jgi:hypothetical protein